MNTMNALEKVKHKEKEYIKCIGGYHNLTEFNQKCNDINREIIKAYKKTFGTCYLGKFYSKDILTEYTGQKIYNFACEFIVKKADEELKQLILDWRTNHKLMTLHKAYNHVKALEGKIIKWV